ncbi:MAG: hypothetical protein SNG38_08375 [Rikenellaceae bacterium]
MTHQELEREYSHTISDSVNANPDQWQQAAKTRQIGATTRRFIELVGAVEDFQYQVLAAVEQAEIVPDTDFDDYTESLTECYLAYREEIQTLLFKQIESKLQGLSEEI